MSQIRRRKNRKHLTIPTNVNALLNQCQGYDICQKMYVKFFRYFKKFNLCQINVLKTTVILFFSCCYLSALLSHHCVTLIYEKYNKFKWRVFFLVDKTMVSLKNLIQRRCWDLDFCSAVPHLTLSLCPTWGETSMWGKEEKKFVFEQLSESEHRTAEDK